MLKLEKILGLLVLMALLLKFTLIPGGGILLTVSLSALAIIYFPLGIALINQVGSKQSFNEGSLKGLSTMKIAGAIGSGMALSTICIGILFKLQRWPGSTMMLLLGLVTSLIVLITSLIKYFKTKGDFYTRIIKRIIIIGGFGFLLFCLSDLTIVKFQFRNYPDFIKAFELYQANPNDESLNKNLDIEYHRIIMTKEDFEKYVKYKEKQ